MSQIEKLIEKLKSNPKDFKYSELVKVMRHIGYIEDTGGKATGSAVNFVNEDDESITIHKPHPGDEIPSPTLKRVVGYLTRKGKL